MRAARYAVLAAAALALTACGGSAAAHKPAASHAAAVATQASSPAVPAGCSQALFVIGAVRSGIADSSMTTDSALKQISSAAKQIPASNGVLREDMDLAAVDLSQWNLAAVQGNPAGKWAKRFANQLAKITRECQP